MAKNVMAKGVVFFVWGIVCIENWGGLA